MFLLVKKNQTNKKNPNNKKQKRNYVGVGKTQQAENNASEGNSGGWGKTQAEWKKEAAHSPPSKVLNNLCSTRQIIYWHCFEGNLGETAERQGGARMGLSERYDAILS